MCCVLRILFNMFYQIIFVFQNLLSYIIGMYFILIWVDYMDALETANWF